MKLISNEFKRYSRNGIGIDWGWFFDRLAVGAFIWSGIPFQLPIKKDLDHSGLAVSYLCNVLKSQGEPCMLPYQSLTQDLVLYLIWDSESETSKDCTLLSSGMSATDAHDDESPKPKRKRSKRSSTESDSETDGSAESESCEEGWGTYDIMICDRYSALLTQCDKGHFRSLNFHWLEICCNMQ